MIHDREYMPRTAVAAGIVTFEVVYDDDPSDYLSTDIVVASCQSREARDAALRLMSVTSPVPRHVSEAMDTAPNLCTEHGPFGHGVPMCPTCRSEHRGPVEPVSE
jgi:hypothetical protein